jgi:hypothetical protein
MAVADVTHTIIAVEDRGLRLLVEGTTITLVAVVLVAIMTTRTTVAAAAAAEGQGALKAMEVLRLLRKDMRMSGTDSMVTMEGGVEMAMDIGKYALLFCFHPHRLT